MLYQKATVKKSTTIFFKKYCFKITVRELHSIEELLAVRDQLRNIEELLWSKYQRGITAQGEDLYRDISARKSLRKNYSTHCILIGKDTRLC
jgi:hypothetical protein